ncbi:MAG: hypothetical protein AAB420_02640 [Patescibacteria group bacterium]
MSNGPVFEAGPGWGGQLGIWMRENLVYIVPGLAVVILIIVLALSGGGNNTSSLIANTSPTSSTSAPSDRSTTVTVLKGDSYTTVARRALSAYTANRSNLNLPGELVYAETALASKIKNQPLTVGSSIVISNEAMDGVLAGWATLSSYQQARWASYRR